MDYNQDIAKLRASIHQSFVGKNDVIDLLLTCLIGSGHILIQDVPGVGKSSLASALAHSIDASFQRIQFTSDLLPADIIGVPIFNGESRTFEFHPGPLFANIILADEINRTTPKTQSALLEAMQERQVTVDRQTHKLSRPFMVIATQNPMEHFGTYPLPESQLDRFLCKIPMGYPSWDEELEIVQTMDLSGQQQPTHTVFSTQRIIELQQAATQVRVDHSLSHYILSIVTKTRQHKDIRLGVSPRGTLALYRATQAYALIQGRDFVTPDDIQHLALDVLAHRIVPQDNHLGQTYSVDLEQAQRAIIQDILQDIAVPI